MGLPGGRTLRPLCAAQAPWLRFLAVRGLRGYHWEWSALWLALTEGGNMPLRTYTATGGQTTGTLANHPKPHPHEVGALAGAVRHPIEAVILIGGIAVALTAGRAIDAIKRRHYRWR